MSANEPLHVWAIRLRELAAQALNATPLMPDGCHVHGNVSDEAKNEAFARSFRDEAGHRRAVDAPLLSRLLGLRPDALPRPRAMSPDVALWWALLDGTTAAADALRAGNGRLLESTPHELSADEGRWSSLEVSTEAELAALHALSHHAARDATLRPRVDSAVAWLLENLQPDNGTNHPWGVHVFLAYAVYRDDVRARLYATTLLHNCQVSLGRPDRFSALLLLDSAAALERTTP